MIRISMALVTPGRAILHRPEHMGQRFGLGCWSAIDDGVQQLGLNHRGQLRYSDRIEYVVQRDRLIINASIDISPDAIARAKLSSTALGPHIALEHAGLPYGPVRVERGKQTDPTYLAINPLARVPALVTETHGTITEAACGLDIHCRHCRGKEAVASKWFAGAIRCPALDRRAQIETRKLYPSPKYWAAFEFTGSAQ